MIKVKISETKHYTNLIIATVHLYNNIHVHVHLCAFVYHVHSRDSCTSVPTINVRTIMRSCNAFCILSMN